MTMVKLLPPLLLLSLAAGCLEEPPYRCQSDAQCFLEGFMGVCDRVSSSCVYPSTDCRGINSVEGFVDGRGNCVPAPNNAVGPTSTTSTTTISSGGGGETTDGPGSSTDPSTTGQTSESADTSGDESTGGSADESSTGGNPMTTGPGCSGGGTDITGQGMVTASSEFDGFPAPLSVDGDLSTSWFSTGPEGGGGPSVYGWNTITDRCIERIEVDDNSGHTNGEFRTGFGFDAATVRVLQDEMVIFEEQVQLPGTPDGPFTVDVGGVHGSRVLLEFGGHENAECGGFSELRVIGGPI